MSWKFMKTFFSGCFVGSLIWVELEYLDSVGEHKAAIFVLIQLLALAGREIARLRHDETTWR